MRVCSICKRCFDDSVVFCTEKSHRSLSKTREGSIEMVAGYRFEMQLESTGPGEIYSAREKASGQPCIVRILAGDEKSLSRFMDESNAAAGFFHPNVVTIYELGNLASGEPYMVTEAPDGQSLQKHLEDVGAPSLLTGVLIARQTAEALYALHLNGLTHRALNPANIILTSEPGNVLTVKLQNIDFGGLVQESVATHKLLDAAGLYALRYFAPEQCAGEKTVPKTDIYALGVIFYEMLAGAPPFEGRTAAALIHGHRNQQPPEIKFDNFELRMLLTHCLSEALQKRAASRQSSANAFARQLRHIEQLKTHISTPPPAGFELPGTGWAAGVAPAKSPAYEKGEKPVATKLEPEFFEPVVDPGTTPPKVEPEPEPPKLEDRPNPIVQKVDPRSEATPVRSGSAEPDLGHTDILVRNDSPEPEPQNTDTLLRDGLLETRTGSDSMAVVKKVNIDSVVVDIDEQLGIPRLPDRAPIVERIKHSLLSFLKTREVEPPPESLHADFESISDLDLDDDLPDMPEYLPDIPVADVIAQENRTLQTAFTPTPGILARSSLEPVSLKGGLPKVDPAEVARTIAELEKKAAARVPTKVAWETPDDDIPSEAEALKVRSADVATNPDMLVRSDEVVPLGAEEPRNGSVVPVIEFEAPEPEVLPAPVEVQPLPKLVIDPAALAIADVRFDLFEDDIPSEADVLEVLAKELPAPSVEDLAAAPSLAELLTDSDHRPVVSDKVEVMRTVEMIEAELAEEVEAEIIVARSVDVIEAPPLLLDPVKAVETEAEEGDAIIEAKSVDVVESQPEIIEAKSADVVETPSEVSKAKTANVIEPKAEDHDTPGAELSPEPESDVSAESALLDALPLPVIDLKSPDDAVPEITHLSFDGSAVEKHPQTSEISHAQRRSRLKLLKRKLRVKTLSPIIFPQSPAVPTLIEKEGPKPVEDGADAAAKGGNASVNECVPPSSPTDARPIVTERAEAPTIGDATVSERADLPVSSASVDGLTTGSVLLEALTKPKETPVIRAKRKKRGDEPVRIKWQQSRDDIPSKAEALEVVLKDEQANLAQKPVESPVFRVKRKKQPEPQEAEWQHPLAGIQPLPLEPISDLSAIRRNELPALQTVPFVPIKPTRIEFADPEEITLVRSKPIRINWESPHPPQDLYLYEDSSPRALEAGYFPTLLGGRETSRTIDLHQTNSVFAAYAESGAHRRIPYRTMMLGGGFMALLLALAFGNDSIRMYVQNLTSMDPIATRKSPPSAPPVRSTTTTTLPTTSTTVDILQPTSKKKSGKSSDKPAATDSDSDSGKSKPDLSKDSDQSQPAVTHTVIRTPVIPTTKVIYSEDGKVRSRTVPNGDVDRSQYPTRPRIVKQPTR